MTDKTYTPADFANAEFARHPDPGRSNAVRNTTTGVWKFSNGLTVDAEHLAERGWSPVRECPDPEQHNPAHDIDWQAVAEQHEDTIKALIKERDEARADLAEYVQAQTFRAVSRPLTPDAITDEMRTRAREAFFTEWDRDDSTLSSVINAALTAALTEPPARPEWADLADAIRAISTRENPDTLAASLHAVGVRVLTEEQP